MHQLLIADSLLESLQSRCKTPQQCYMEKIFNASFTAFCMQWIFRMLIQLLLKVILLKRTFDLLN